MIATEAYMGTPQGSDQLGNEADRPLKAAAMTDRGWL